MVNTRRRILLSGKDFDALMLKMGVRVLPLVKPPVPICSSTILASVPVGPLTLTLQLSRSLGFLPVALPVAGR